MTNLIFLSGPHGAGKTTLLENILKEIPNAISPELETTTLKFDIEPEDGLVLKVCQRSLENYEYLTLAQKNPDKIILGNRCIYDQQAYNNVYWMRGWMERYGIDTVNALAENFYIQGLRRPYAIVLNPGFDVVKKHLEKRWSEKGKKWKEDDLEYDKLACEAFQKYKGIEKIYYIDHEIADKHSELISLKNWILDVYNKDIKKEGKIE